VTHSKPGVNPSGGAVPRHAVPKPALDTSLLERVVEPQNMRRAWKRVTILHGRENRTCVSTPEGRGPGRTKCTGPRSVSRARRLVPTSPAAL
jgi:hypothetical protein